MRITGIDVGKKHDPTALIEAVGDPRDSYRMFDCAQRLPVGMSYIDQAMELRTKVNASDAVLVDSTGVGEAFIEILKDKAPDANIYGVTLTSGTKVRINLEQKTVCVPKRSLIAHFVTCVEKHVIILDVIDSPHKETMDILFEEMSTFQRAGDGTMNAALGKHDDLVIAAALALFGFSIAQRER